MIFVSANGEVIGQFEESDLPSALAAGKFPADAHFWREGMPSWRPLRELPLPPKARPFSTEPKLKLSAPTGAPVVRRPFVPRPRQDAAPSGDAPASGLPPVNPAPAVTRRTVLPGLKAGEEREKFPVPSPVPATAVRRDAVPMVPAEPAPPVAPPAEEAPSREAVPNRPGLTPFVPGQKTFIPRAKAVLPPAEEPEAPTAPVAPTAPAAPVAPTAQPAPTAPAAPAVGVARPLRTPPAAVPVAAPAAPVNVKATPPPAQRFMAVDKPGGGAGSFLRRGLLIAALPLMASAGAAAWWFWPSGPSAPPALEVEVLLPGPGGAPAAVAGAQVFVVGQEELATLWRSRLESAPAVDPGLAESLERAKAAHREKELARELAVRISELGDEYNMPDAEQLRAESEAAQAAEAAALVELEKLTAESEAVSGPAEPVLSAPEGRAQETATDEAGRFTLPLPPAGQEGMVALVLAAPGEGESEPRGWLVPLEGAGQRTEAVRLSADNLLDLEQIRQIAGLSSP